ncbi:MAG: 1-acyl-sn-glycerol-3-phosphate acyltransferase [Victivallales bacterium]|nr:1-acyl-sn-glycerol-3-phosphate acyltransferase [Victivallales bacterium]
MKILRRLYRIVGVFFWFFMMAFYGLSFHLLYFRKNKAALIKRLSFAEKVWSGGLAKIIGLKIKVFGSVENIKGMLVSNHLSYVDIITLGAVFPIRFTPKKEIASWPFLGWFIRISQPIWINRTSKQDSLKVVRQFADTIKNGTRLVVFPEGTTSDGKGDLLQFKSAVFDVAVTQNIRLCPVLVHYNGNEGSEIPWYGDDSLLGHVWKLLAIKRVNAEVHILEPVEIAGRNRKKLSKDIYNYMNKEYKKICVRS